uniref:Glucoside xylosyltransferase 1b n=1 Tax=Sinocyclocheilus grahami TaxID=75366 RepID=A0A672SJ92_SINGR
ILFAHRRSEIYSFPMHFPLVQLDSWPAFIRAKFSYVVHSISFPHENHEEWSQLFKPCASQRLFLPMMLKEVDSLLYPVELIWDMLTHFNSTRLVAMTPEELRIAWCSRLASTLNGMTSVGLHWDKLLMPLLQEYKLNITWGDQDLTNIIFHYNPEMIFTFPCPWNYRPDHCIYGSNCILAEEGGCFNATWQQAVYDLINQLFTIFWQYIFGEDLIKSFLFPLEEALNRTTHTYGGKVSNFFTRGLGMSVRKIQKMLPAGG